ncbi:RNA polymerase sigma factor [Aequorivita viscosa]|uniref:RNA polymerase sigma factor, sigma-70 family n=1 Tax=Aequorivita viscosa TaxID=797419 RepID=A0A1M6P4S2_9FLAO|nr:sigma-70 family RNA polymerase sigma factor [Aequorivita viscosa]SDX51654.1 RNA polymerase sigma factor, sigma-70 family [Aequorivita viscosa]SHK02893.1 RNA polymerase sigma factor, sigma-70 family [Aequorivita viscosa]
MKSNTFIQLKQGCPNSLTAIYDEYQRRIFGLGRYFLRDEFVVECLMQDTFLKLWVNRDRIERPEHILFFLLFVMKRECISYYTRPRNDFNRKIRSLDSFDNYQEYMAGYDSLSDTETQRLQAEEQQHFELIQSVLPLLDAEGKHLIELCLKYGFRYKAIAQAMGSSVTDTSNKVKKAIAALKIIVCQGGTLNSEQKPATIKLQGAMTPEQAEILKLRCENKYSFADIAQTLNRPQKEIHREFITAYKLIQQKHHQQTQPT